MSLMKRVHESVDHVITELEAICLENEHATGDSNGQAYVRVCNDCALAIEIIESEFTKLGMEIGPNN